MLSLKVIKEQDINKTGKTIEELHCFFKNCPTSTGKWFLININNFNPY